MNKSTLLAFSLVTLLLTSLQSCVECVQGEGEAQTESRAILDFEVLRLDCSANVEIRENLVSEKNKVEVIAPENLLPYIKTTNDGKKLVVDIEGCVSSTTPIVVKVYTNGMQKIISNGSGDISCQNALKGDRLSIVSNGSGSLDLQFRGKEADIESDGSGNVTIKGGAGDLEIDCAGSGDVKADQFKADAVSVDNSGSGNVVVSVKSDLSINLNGSGDVRYKGNPQQLEQSNNGSGSIVKLN